MTTKIGVVQLGCAKNQVDGEEMLGALAAEGDAVFVSDKRDADILVVNTCGFIDAAKEESVNAILDAVRRKARGQVQKVIVTGCLAQRFGAELAREIPEVDAFLGIESAPQIGNVVFAPRMAPPASNNGGAGLVEPGVPVSPVPTLSGVRGLLVTPVADKYPLVPQTRLRATATPWTAYLKVSEGCDHPCTFCAIPGIRGRHRSKSIERLTEEAAQLVSTGATELCLVAQDTTAYGMDLYGRLALPELLAALNGVPGIRWIRLLYCYPTMVQAPLIDALVSLPKVLPYMDMPLQHGDAQMLKAMKRGGSPDQYRRLFDKLRVALPSITLRTTFLVGFPGETDAHFANLLRFVEDVRFDRVGAFTFSAEEGTPAFDMEQSVPPAVMRERKNALLAAQQSISLARNRAQIGREMDVLVEKAPSPDNGRAGLFPPPKLGGPGGPLVGRTLRDAPEIDGTITVTDCDARPGEYVRVRVTDADVYDLTARAV